MTAEIFPAATVEAGAETLPLLNPAERRAFRDLAGTSQPLMQIPPRTVLRLLAQVEAQARLLLLHERREKGLRESVANWQGMGAGFADYYDAAEELKAVLDDPHYGDPAYQEPDMEHDGIGWRTPYPPRDIDLPVPALSQESAQMLVA